MEARPSLREITSAASSRLDAAMSAAARGEVLSDETMVVKRGLADRVRSGLAEVRSGSGKFAGGLVRNTIKNPTFWYSTLTAATVAGVRTLAMQYGGSEAGEAYAMAVGGLLGGVKEGLVESFRSKGNYKKAVGAVLAGAVVGVATSSWGYRSADNFGMEGFSAEVVKMSGTAGLAALSSFMRRIGAGEVRSLASAQSLREAAVAGVLAGAATGVVDWIKGPISEQDVKDGKAVGGGSVGGAMTPDTGTPDAAATREALITGSAPTTVEGASPVVATEVSTPVATAPGTLQPAIESSAPSPEPTHTATPPPQVIVDERSPFRRWWDEMTGRGGPRGGVVVTPTEVPPAAESRPGIEMPGGVRPTVTAGSIPGTAAPIASVTPEPGLPPTDAGRPEEVDAPPVASEPEVHEVQAGPQPDASIPTESVPPAGSGGAPGGGLTPPPDSSEPGQNEEKTPDSPPTGSEPVEEPEEAQVPAAPHDPLSEPIPAESADQPENVSSESNTSEDEAVPNSSPTQNPDEEIARRVAEEAHAKEVITKYANIEPGIINTNIQADINDLMQKNPDIVDINTPEGGVLTHLSYTGLRPDSLDVINLKEPDEYYGNLEGNPNISSLKGLTEGRIGELILRDPDFLVQRNEIIQQLLDDPTVDTGVKESLQRIRDGVELPTDNPNFTYGNGAHQLILEKFRDANPEKYKRMFDVGYVVSKINNYDSAFIGPDTFKHNTDIRVPKLSVLKKVYQL